jgi:hypothetical protein
MSFVCADPPGFNRKSFHTTFDAQVLDFFRRQLLDNAAAAARAGSVSFFSAGSRSAQQRLLLR